MRKALIIMIAVILMLGVSGCESLQAAAQNTMVPLTQEAEASPTQDALSRIDVANASQIATAVNAYNMLNPFDMLPDDATLEDAKEALVEYNFWPELSGEEAKAAWELITIKDGVADLTPEAQEAWD
jgi:hypothetical protein